VAAVVELAAHQWSMAVVVGVEIALVLRHQCRPRMALMASEEVVVLVTHLVIAVLKKVGPVEVAQWLSASSVRRFHKSLENTKFGRRRRALITVSASSPKVGHP
jgi:hypothetical protein